MDNIYTQTNCPTYSQDIRDLFQYHKSKGKTLTWIAEVLNISYNTIKIWNSKSITGEKFKDKRFGNSTKKKSFSDDDLKLFIDNNVNATLKEIGNHFSVSDVAILKCLRNTDFSYIYIYIYIDESGIDHNEIKQKSWSPIGKPISSEQYGYKYKRTTLIAGIRGNKVLAPFRFEGNTNTDIFNTWLEKFLCSELNGGDVVILNNASFHKSEKTRILIEYKKIKLLYLPPYSPDGYFGNYM